MVSGELLAESKINCYIILKLIPLQVEINQRLQEFVFKNCLKKIKLSLFIQNMEEAGFWSPKVSFSKVRRTNHLSNILPILNFMLQLLSFTIYTG